MPYAWSHFYWKAYRATWTPGLRAIFLHMTCLTTKQAIIGVFDNSLLRCEKCAVAKECLLLPLRNQEFRALFRLKKLVHHKDGNVPLIQLFWQFVFLLNNCSM
jgi:hypothetical protein